MAKETRVRIRNYMDYSSDNYGAHSLEVHISSLTLWFSYKTIVGFEDRGKVYQEAYSENVWGPTTGKHLNALCPKPQGTTVA